MEFDVKRGEGGVFGGVKRGEKEGDDVLGCVGLNGRWDEWGGEEDGRRERRERRDDGGW